MDLLFSNTYSGIIGTCIGTFIGALLTYCVSIRVTKKQHFYLAAGEFQAEFVNEIISLESAQEDAYKILSKPVIEQHRKAKVRFEHCIPKREIKKFNEAWERYESNEGTHIRTKAPGSLDQRPGECRKALNLIRDLLEFAKI